MLQLGDSEVGVPNHTELFALAKSLSLSEGILSLLIYKMAMLLRKAAPVEGEAEVGGNERIDICLCPLVLCCHGICLPLRPEILPLECAGKYSLPKYLI